MKRKLLALVLLGALLLSAFPGRASADTIFVPFAGQGADQDGTLGNDSPINPPVTGTVDDPRSLDGSFSGHFNLEQFELGEDGESVYAVGTLTGEIRDSQGKLQYRGALENVRVPVDMNSVFTTSAEGESADSESAAASCGVLHLEFGPVDITVEGVTVHLGRVSLDIEAGSLGGDLGPLICLIAKLLGGGTAVLPTPPSFPRLPFLIDLLNQIIALLSSTEGPGPIVRTATLSGANVVPGPGDPDGSGIAVIKYHERGRGKLCWDIKVENIGAATAANIHRGLPGSVGEVVVGFSALSSDGRVCILGLIDVPTAVLEDIKDHPEQYYVLVYTDDFPDGAIRGQLSK